MTSISDTEVVNAPGGLVELGYAEKTSNTTITGTSVTSPTTVISAITVVCDGSPVLIECYVPYLQTTASANVSAYIVLKTDNDRSLMGIVNSETASSAAYGSGVFLKRITPSAGVHTFALESYTQSGTGTLGGGTGSSNGWSPVFLRVSKIIQASQLLVTQSNAPIVTSLPSGNLVTGQEVHLYSSSPAGYQKQFWDGTQWNLMGDSRPVPSVRAVRSTTDTGFTGFKNIQWNAADAWDTDNLHDPSTNADRITFTRSGIYIVTLAIYLDYTGSPSYADCRIKGNNTTVLAEDYRIPPAGSYLTTLTAHVNTTSYSYVVADAVISGATSATLRGDVANMCWFSATYLGKN